MFSFNLHAPLSEYEVHTAGSSTNPQEGYFHQMYCQKSRISITIGHFWWHKIIATMNMCKTIDKTFTYVISFFTNKILNLHKYSVWCVYWSFWKIYQNQLVIKSGMRCLVFFTSFFIIPFCSFPSGCSCECQWQECSAHSQELCN